MKCVIYITILNFVLNASALPLRMLRPLPLTRNLMYVQYVQPQQSGGIRTYSDGQLLGSESYSKDCADENMTGFKTDLNAYGTYDDPPQQPSDTTSPVGDFEPNSNNHEINDKTNVNEYPQIEFHQTENKREHNDHDINSKDEIDEKNYINTEQPQISTTPISYDEKTTKTITNEQNPVRSVLNTEAYLPPKKRVYVDLEDTNTDEGGYKNINYFHQKNDRAHSTTNKNEKPVGLPIGTYFPLHFGDSSGSTIAVANSFSTGSGGSAVSHAIAYGNPNSGNGPKKSHLRNKFQLDAKL